MTTDRAPKACTVSAGGVTVSAQAKGAGMMQPGFATMLCFVQTDAEIAEPEAELRRAVAGSFERISVDGQMSTNDTVLLQATGEAGAPLPDGAARRGPAAARARDRRRRRGRDPGRPDRGRRGRRRGRGRARRARDRELAAGEDGAVRPRPELGPDRPGGRDGARRRGARGARRPRRSTPRSSAATRRRPRSRSGSAAGARAPTCTSPTSTTNTSGSTRSTRREMPATSSALAPWPRLAAVI